VGDGHAELIAKTIRATTEEEMIGIRDFLDSRMGRHFADDVVGNMVGCRIDTETAIRSSIRTWQDWRISRQLERDEGRRQRAACVGWQRNRSVMSEKQKAPARGILRAQLFDDQGIGQGG